MNELEILNNLITRCIQNGQFKNAAEVIAVNAALDSIGEKLAKNMEVVEPKIVDRIKTK